MKNTLSYGNKWGLGLLSASLVLTVLAVGAPVRAEDAPSIRVNVSESVILTAENVDKVAVADPTIANVVVLSDKELSIIGIKVGVTTLTIVHKESQPSMPTKQYRIEVFNQTATASFDSAAATIRQMTGQQAITVRSLGDTLVLDGQVDDEIQMQRAAQVAGASSVKVLNLLEVKNPRQIRIRTRVVEVTTDNVKRLGIKYFGDNGDVTYGYGRVSIHEGAGGNFSGSGFVGQGPQANATITAGTAPVAITATMSALLSKGQAKLLSEPTLVTFSGKEASFLVGEEIPITQQLQNTFTVEYKEVGVRMKIKPIADSQNRVNTMIHAEVSQAVNTIGPQSLPVILTRKADTTLQVNDGQTIVIGGLLENNVNRDALRKVPWLAEIPLFGYLFRHKDFSQQQREVIFFMTPEILKNIEADVAGAAKTPEMKEWNGKKSDDGILDIPPPDWADEYEKRLHNQLAIPSTEKPEEPAPAKQPTTNIQSGRPAGQ